MRKTKSLLALLCAVVAAFVLAVPAFAVGENHTITIDAQTKGHKYQAYQVFSGELDAAEDTLTNIAWGVNVNETKLLQDLIQESGTDNSPIKDVFTGAANAYDVAKALEKMRDNSEQIDKVAEIIGANLQGNPKESGDEPEDLGASEKYRYRYTITGLDSGYYFIKDQDNSLDGASDAYTKFILEVVHNVAVDAKADMPPVEKAITGVTGYNRDGEKAEAVPNVPTSADAAIGDTVEFTITSRVPNMDGYNRYIFVVNDTLSKGLTIGELGQFTADDVTITFINPDEGEDRVLRPGTEYSVAATSNADDSYKTDIEIVFKNFMDVAAGHIGWDIEIVYSATVDSDAVIGNAGNPNDVSLTYSNNPNVNYEGDKPGPDEPVGITPKSTVKVYVAGIQINKVDENGEPLAGAEFTLTGNTLNTVVVTKGEFVALEPEDEEGQITVYYPLIEGGAYTTTAPTEQTASHYVDGMGAQKYKLGEKTEVVTRPAETVQYKGFVDANGVLRFEGLKAGTYTLSETVVPDGYNKAEDITFTVTFQVPTAENGNQAFTITPTGVFESVDDGEDNLFKAEIENRSGATLPSTGGIGTTIFYAVGATLVIGAGVVLVSRYRANHMK